MRAEDPESRSKSADAAEQKSSSELDDELEKNDSVLHACGGRREVAKEVIGILNESLETLVLRAPRTRCEAFLEPLEEAEGEREGKDRGSHRLLKALTVIARLKGFNNRDKPLPVVEIDFSANPLIFTSLPSRLGGGPPGKAETVIRSLELAVHLARNSDSVSRVQLHETDLCPDPGEKCLTEVVRLVWRMGIGRNSRFLEEIGLRGNSFDGDAAKKIVETAVKERCEFKAGQESSAPLWLDLSGNCIRQPEVVFENLLAWAGWAHDRDKALCLAKDEARCTRKDCPFGAMLHLPNFFEQRKPEAPVEGAPLPPKPPRARSPPEREREAGRGERAQQQQRPRSPHKIASRQPARRAVAIADEERGGYQHPQQLLHHYGMPQAGYGGAYGYGGYGGPWYPPGAPQSMTMAEYHYSQQQHQQHQQLHYSGAYPPEPDRGRRRHSRQGEGRGRKRRRRTRSGNRRSRSRRSRSRSRRSPLRSRSRSRSCYKPTSSPVRRSGSAASGSAAGVARSPSRGRFSGSPSQARSASAPTRSGLEEEDEAEVEGAQDESMEDGARSPPLFDREEGAGSRRKGKKLDQRIDRLFESLKKKGSNTKKEEESSHRERDRRRHHHDHDDHRKHRRHRRH